MNLSQHRYKKLIKSIDNGKVFILKAGSLMDIVRIELIWFVATVYVMELNILCS